MQSFCNLTILKLSIVYYYVSLVRFVDVCGRDWFVDGFMVMVMVGVVGGGDRVDVGVGFYQLAGVVEKL